MPYASDKQRRYMHAKHPDIAARWDKESKLESLAKRTPKVRRRHVRRRSR